MASLYIGEQQKNLEDFDANIAFLYKGAWQETIPVHHYLLCNVMQDLQCMQKRFP
jgi:hypothetical protein